MTTGERIKQLRKELGLSADKLGELIGKDRSTIYRYERGDIESATIDVLPRLAKALRTTPQYIMGWDDKPAFYWADSYRSPELSEISKWWYDWTMRRYWPKKEVDVFAAQAQYIVSIRGTDKYETMIQFLTTFYQQLNK